MLAMQARGTSTFNGHEVAVPRNPVSCKYCTKSFAN